VVPRPEELAEGGAAREDGGMDERVRADLSLGVKEDCGGPARPQSRPAAPPDAPERVRYAGVAALCFLAVALLSPLNVYLLIVVELLLWGRLAGRLGDEAVYAYPVAALAQTALFAVLWLPLDTATRRWPAPARCFATAALTAAYLGLWLAWNLWAFGP
jgi:hypothetical protein